MMLVFNLTVLSAGIAVTNVTCQYARLVLTRKLSCSQGKHRHSKLLDHEKTHVICLIKKVFNVGASFKPSKPLVPI